MALLACPGAALSVLSSFIRLLDDSFMIRALVLSNISWTSCALAALRKGGRLFPPPVLALVQAEQGRI